LHRPYTSREKRERQEREEREQNEQEKEEGIGEERYPQQS